MLRAADAFALYFNVEVLKMVSEQRNRMGAQKYLEKWIVLKENEPQAYFGPLLLISMSQ